MRDGGTKMSDVEEQVQMIVSSREYFSGQG